MGLAVPHRGRARRLTLGRWPGIGLAGARKAAWEARRLVGEGKDPAVLRATAARDASRDPFENVVAEFIEKYAKPKNRSWERPSDCFDGSWSSDGAAGPLRP